VLREKDFVEDDHDPYNLEQLEHELKMSYSLVVLYGAPPFTDGTVRLLAKARHPFLIVGGPRATACNCIGSIGYSMDRAVGEFTEHCRRTGVKRAVFVRKWRDDRSNVATALRKVGVKVEVLSVPQRVERGRSEDLWRMAYASFERILSEKGRKWLPDLIYFTDDHCFQGAVMSLLKRRISVPVNVRLVTETNAGIRPPFYIPIASIEYDLKKSAKIISAAMLDYLDRGRKIPDDLFLDCEYVPGDTFP
jgi:DNA-binding LacI/PurR family transcriptional regulator